MFKHVKNAFCVAAIVSMASFSAVTANAATFDFTGDLLASIAPDSASKTFSVDGIDLTVTAGTFSSGSNPSNIDFSTRLVDQDFFSGLGADGSFDGDQVDGSFGNDVLVFSFLPGVIIESIDFGNVDGNDDFAFGSVLGTSFSRIVDFQDVTNIVTLSSFATQAQSTGSSFGIGAIGSFDNFTIQKITVSAVPLPAALPLLAGGLGLMGLLGWRRKRKVATA